MFGGLRIGYPYCRERKGQAMGRPPHPGAPPHPLGWQQLLPLAGAWGYVRVPVTTSPRLELELSPDLLCGQRANGAVSKEVGVRAGILFSHRLPPPHPWPSFASPTGEASGNSVSSEYEVNPWGLLLAGRPPGGGSAPPPARHLELRRFCAASVPAAGAGCPV